MNRFGQTSQGVPNPDQLNLVLAQTQDFQRVQTQLNEIIAGDVILTSVITNDVVTSGLTVSGGTIFDGALDVTGDIIVEGNLSVTGTVTCHTIQAQDIIGEIVGYDWAGHSMTLESSLSVAGSMNVGQGVELESSLTVEGGTIMLSTLSVAGKSTLGEVQGMTISVAGNAIVNSNLSVGALVTNFINSSSLDTDITVVTNEGTFDIGETLSGLLSNMETIDGQIITLQSGLSVAQADINGFPDDLKNLTQGEIGQLENINSTTISSGTWANLGAVNQGLTTTSDVTFNRVDLTEQLVINRSGADAMVQLREGGNGRYQIGYSVLGSNLYFRDQQNSYTAMIIRNGSPANVEVNNNLTTIGALITDTIEERSVNSGIRVDGVHLKDSGLIASYLSVGGDIILSGSLSTDTIAEKTSGSGVTVDGVLLKDSGLISSYLSVGGDIILSGSLFTDTIVEKTSNQGVTIEGVNIKDGAIDADSINVVVSSISVSGNVTIDRLSLDPPSGDPLLTFKESHTDKYLIGYSVSGDYLYINKPGVGDAIVIKDDDLGITGTSSFTLNNATIYLGNKASGDVNFRSGSSGDYDDELTIDKEDNTIDTNSNTLVTPQLNLHGRFENYPSSSSGDNVWNLRQGELGAGTLFLRRHFDVDDSYIDLLTITKSDTAEQVATFYKNVSVENILQRNKSYLSAIGTTDYYTYGSNIFYAIDSAFPAGEDIRFDAHNFIQSVEKAGCCGFEYTGNLDVKVHVIFNFIGIGDGSKEYEIRHYRPTGDVETLVGNFAWAGPSGSTTCHGIIDVAYGDFIRGWVKNSTNSPNKIYWTCTISEVV